MRPASLLLLSFSLLLATRAPAQVRPLQIGDRVRLAAPAFQGQAHIIGLSPEVLSLALPSPPGTALIPWSNISSLELNLRRSRFEGAVHGAKWGAGVGSLLGLLMLTLPGSPEEELTVEELAGMAFIEGVVIGTAIGAFRPGSRWRRLPVASAREAVVLELNVPTPPADAVAAPVTVRRSHNPIVELTLGFDGPQLEHAQFPGVTGSIAFNRARNDRFGGALLGQLDLISYLQRGLMAGPRLYARTAPLREDNRPVTYFAQVLAGRVVAEESGVISTNGGMGLQPGAGLDWGGQRMALRIQVDYRVVPGGTIQDSRLENPEIAKLSGVRVLIGVTGRLSSL